MSGDLALSSLDPAELTELRTTVRAAVNESGYPARARELEAQATAPGLDPELWRLLAEDIGIAGVGLPETAGGLGGLAEILAVAEELGATLAPGSIGAQLLFSLPGDVSKFLPLISGLLLILFVLQNQDGSAKEMSLMGRLLLSKMPWGRRPEPTPKAVSKAREAAEAPSIAVKVSPKVLEVKDLTVRYGMTTAVDSVSFTIEPGSRTIAFTAVRDIGNGDEVTINYHGTPDDDSPVWFQTV
jgi:hypothetical protein